MDGQIEGMERVNERVVFMVTQLEEVISNHDLKNLVGEFLDFVINDSARITKINDQSMTSKTR